MWSAEGENDIATVPRQPDTPHESDRIVGNDAIPQSSGAAPGPIAVPVPPRYRFAAARRLVSPDTPDRDHAAHRLLTGGIGLGVRLDLMWAVIDESDQDDPVKEACLMVLGAGRTAVAFLSGPEDRRARSLAPPPRATAERAACLHAGLADLSMLLPNEVRVAQALPDPSERWAVDAYAAAGFLRVGELSYLRCGLARGKRDCPDLPSGVEMRPLRGLEPGSEDRTALERAMDRSYIDTMDCPTLCGMRSTEDILDSHLSVGRWSPQTWSLLLADGEPEGCCLLSLIPEQRIYELVYLGLGPNLRGRGLGRPVLARGLSALDSGTATSVICAVDTENTPAVRLYRSMGFTPMARREAFVVGLPGHASA